MTIPDHAKWQRKKVKQPQKRAISGCSSACSFNPLNLGQEVADKVHNMIEMDDSLAEIMEYLKTTSAQVSQAGLSRHRMRHTHPIVERPSVRNGPISELDLLNEMIAKGGELVALPDFKMTAEQLLRAMELKLKLTQGSVFDQAYAAMRAAQGADLDAEYEESKDQDAASQASTDESQQGATDDAAG